jgi:hypothetical protein
MDTVSSQSTSHTPESLPKFPTLVKPLRPRPYLIATWLLKAPTSQITAEGIQKWLAEKYPHCRYTKRQIWDFLRHGSSGEDPIFMIVNKFRAAGDLNRWAIRPEIEPQLRRWWSDPPPPQPPCLHFSSNHPQSAPAVREAASAALCEPQTGSKRTASWKSPRAATVSVLSCPMLGIKQQFPQPALPSSGGENPLADQSSGKRPRISHQEASAPTQQHFQPLPKNPSMTWPSLGRRNIHSSPSLSKRNLKQ